MRTCLKHQRKGIMTPIPPYADSICLAIMLLYRANNLQFGHGMLPARAIGTSVCPANIGILLLILLETGPCVNAQIGDFLTKWWQVQLLAPYLVTLWVQWVSMRLWNLLMKCSLGADCSLGNVKCKWGRTQSTDFSDFLLQSQDVDGTSLKAIHSLAHVYYMRHEYSKGIELLRSTSALWMVSSDGFMLPWAFLASPISWLVCL